MFSKNLFGNKGQIQIGVTIMVLLVFIILLMISLAIYFRFTFEEIQNANAELLDQRYSSLLSTIIGMPELRCSRNSVEEECLDAAKLKVISRIISKNNDHYKRIFSDVDQIWVEMPSNDGTDDYFDTSEFNIYGSESDGVIYSAPVSVYYPDYKWYKLGVLKIRGKL